MEGFTLHPVYSAEIDRRRRAMVDPGLQEKLGLAAGGIAREPENAKAELDRIADDRQRTMVAMFAITALAQAGAPIDVCDPIVECLRVHSLTDGERYQLAEVYSRIGRFHREGQDLQTAIDVYRRGLAVIDGLPDRATMSGLRYNLGVAFEQSGDHEAAADAFDVAARIDAALGNTADAAKGTARARTNRRMARGGGRAQVADMIREGARLRQSGNMAAALQTYLLARQQALRSRDPDLIAKATASVSGVFFYQGEPARARDVLVDGLASLSDAPDSRPSVFLRATLGTNLVRLGDLAGAEREFHRALDVASKQGWNEEVDTCESGLAEAVLAKKDYARAHAMYLRLLERRRDAANPSLASRLLRKISLGANRASADGIKLGNALNQVGIVAFRLGRVDEALAHHHEALGVRRAHHDVRGMAESAQTLGVLYEDLGKYRDALRYYLCAVRLHERIRRGIGTGAESRTSFLEPISQNYYNAARLACAMSRGGVAHAVTQRAQNRTLVDDLSTAPVERPPDVPMHLFDEESGHLARIRAAAGDPLRTLDAVRQLTSFYDGPVASVSPEYVHWRKGKPMSAPSLLNELDRLGSGTAFVELVEKTMEAMNGEWNTTLFGVCARAGDSKLRVLYGSTPLGTTPPAASDRPALAAAVAREFAGLLDVLGGPGDLYVVAHGSLANFPLHSMPIGGRQLLAWQPVRFIPHVTFLAGQRWSTSRPTTRFAVFGDSQDDLPGARNEASLVAKALRVPPLLGPSATVAAIADAFGEADLIHFAGHAFFDHADPANSGIVASDGQVTAADIRRWRIRARVVVLNACESGVHGKGLGNELNGFVRSLLLGGVRHVVCTLERVEDDMAQKFARALYDGVGAAGFTNVPRSVQRAQLAVGEDYGGGGGIGNPFILVG